MKSDSNVDSLTEEDEQEKFFNLISEDNEDEIKKYLILKMYMKYGITKTKKIITPQ